MSDTVADDLKALRPRDDVASDQARGAMPQLRPSDELVCSRGDERMGHRAGPGFLGAGVPANRHLPIRPQWTCAVDGKPWPCAGARIHLRSQFVDDRVGLAVYMSTQLMTAAVDITNGDALPPDLFNRFMAWT